MDTETQKQLGPGGTPPTPKPLHPDTPWWAVLVAVLVTAVVSIVGTVYAMRGGPSISGTTSLPSGIAVDTITYMPHILLLFGVLADMFTYDGVWSIPSLVGILSIFVNYLMQYFWAGLQDLFSAAKNVAVIGSTKPATVAAPANPFVGGEVKQGSFFKTYDGCSVQGFEWLKTDFAPQTLVVTATVFLYYIFDLVVNRGWMNSIASIVIFGAVYVLQVGVLQMTSPEGSCGGEYGHFAQALMALFEGVVFGGSAYGIVQTYYPERLPSTTMSVFPRKSKKNLTMGPDGKMYDADGYPYVVLPNGQAVPDLSTAQSRNAFAKIAGDKLGTCLPAKPKTCPN